MILKALKDGEPLPRINRIFVNAIGNLEIKDVRVEDEGFYVCSISNSHSTKYAQAELVVNGIVNNLEDDTIFSLFLSLNVLSSC